MMFLLRMTASSVLVVLFTLAVFYLLIPFMQHPVGGWLGFLLMVAWFFAGALMLWMKVFAWLGGDNGHIR